MGQHTGTDADTDPAPLARRAEVGQGHDAGERDQLDAEGEVEGDYLCEIAFRWDAEPARHPDDRARGRERDAQNPYPEQRLRRP